MAMSMSGSKSGSLRRTELGTAEKGSTEVIEYNCDICVGPQTVPAEGHCKQCQQFLCSNCCSQHRIINCVKFHKILSLDEFQEVAVQPPLFGAKLMPVCPFDIPYSCKTQVVKQICSVNTGESTKDAILCACDDPKTSSLYLFNPNGDAKRMIYFGYQNVCSMLQICTSNETNMLYFSVPEEKKIMVYEIESNKDTTYDIKTTFKTSGQCFAMTAFNNGLALLIKLAIGASEVPDWQIQFVSTDGTVKQRICYDKNGDKLLQEPTDIATNNEKTTMYISDTQAILAFDTNGDNLFQIIDDPYLLYNPSVLTVDNDNNIYAVCVDGQDSKIVQIHGTTKEARALLTVSSCSSIGFNQTTRTLIMAKDKCSEIFVFSFC